MWLQVRLPPGYPHRVNAQVYVTGLPTRQTQEQLSAQLTAAAVSLLGSESVMELVQVAQQALDDIQTKGDTTPSSPLDTTQQLPASPPSNEWCRAWIWVHHIKDTDRRKAIVREAGELGLHGCIKYGYPGIVVLEGPTHKCNEFIAWIKGNKSRPGGFGRNWGHHVRGQMSLSSETELCFPAEFQMLQDMKELGSF